MLNEEKSSFKEKDFLNDNYILSSNIYNDYKERDENILKKEFRLKKNFESKGVFIKLYERKIKNE